jgi:hypothetical protein
MGNYNLLKNIRDDQKFPPKGFNSSNYPRLVRGTMTSAEVLASYTTPKTVIAGGGEGVYIEVIRATFFMNHGGTDYAAADDMFLRYTNEAGAIIATLPEVAFVEAAADAVYVPALASVTVPDAAPVVISAGTSDPTTGNGDIEYEITYRYITFTT